MKNKSAAPSELDTFYSLYPQLAPLQGLKCNGLYIYRPFGGCAKSPVIYDRTVLYNIT